MVGKWHLGSRPTGFYRWIILPGQGNPQLQTPAGTLTLTGHTTGLTGQLGIGFMKTRPSDKPFFLMLHHKVPHRNWAPGDRNPERFANVHFAETKTLCDDYATRPAAFTENSRRSLKASPTRRQRNSSKKPPLPA
jgi:hypothetical protein